MFRKILLRVVLLIAMTTGLVSLSADRASAGWHHWGYTYGVPYVSVYYPSTYFYAPYYAPSTYYAYRPLYHPRYYAYPTYSNWAWTSYYRTVCCGWHDTSAIGYYYYRPIVDRACCRPTCYTSCYRPRCRPLATTYYYDPTVSCCGSTVVSPPAPQSPGPEPTPAPPASAPPAPQPPAEAPQPQTQPETQSLLPPAPADASIQRTGRAMLVVQVPSDAQVYVNGHSTVTPGTRRVFVSKGLEAGYQYTYQVRADAYRDGHRVSKTQFVHLKAGDVRDVVFDLDSPRQLSDNQVPTTLTLHVPADAKVFLEGQETAATGSVRSFTTTELGPGSEWKDYDIVVSIERFGQELTQKKSVTLVGGQTRDLQIDFDAAQVASR